jgi:hypothetical protein
MPSGGLTPIDMEDAQWCWDRAKEGVVKYGLSAEIFAYFIGGIKAGVEPREAMHLACIEWDV